MRTIKFRGLRVNRREWVYSTESFVQTDEGICMGLYNEEKDVIPDTVGQFTGLYDKDGKEIYEGDILQLKYSDGSYHSSSVYYAQQKGYWAVDVSINERIILGYIDRTQLVVIGNIHDNPELLK